MAGKNVNVQEQTPEEWLASTWSRGRDEPQIDQWRVVALPKGQPREVLETINRPSSLASLTATIEAVVEGAAEDAPIRVEARCKGANNPETAKVWRKAVPVVELDGSTKGIMAELGKSLRDAHMRLLASGEEERRSLRAEFLWERPPGCPSDLPLDLLLPLDLRRHAVGVSCQQDIAGDGAFSLGMVVEFELSLIHICPGRARWSCASTRPRRLPPRSGCIGSRPTPRNSVARIT